MQKIISLFKRNYEGDRLVIDDIVDGAEWVVAGEGIATVKWDGTACMVRDGKLYTRYDAKPGRTPPAEFEPAQEPDAITGHWPGWVPVTDRPEHKWFKEAFKSNLPMSDGTYECVGPKIQGNPHKLSIHLLVRHGHDILDPQPPQTFAGLKAWFEVQETVEGIVWHHPDGRMVKIKRRDFGLPWPPKST